MKKLSYLFLILILALCLPFAISCSNEDTAGSQKISMQGSLVITEGCEKVLDPSVPNFDGKLNWSSSDETVLTVDDGVVYAKKIGSATVTVQAGEDKADCIVSVVEVPLSLNKSTLTIFEDDSARLIANVGDYNKDVLWSSSDENVVTVDKDGNLYAKNIGQSTITVKAGSKQKTCVVTVQDGGFIPYISYSGSSDKTILLGDTYPLEVTVTYKGEKITPDSLTATVSNGNVVSTSVNGSIVNIESNNIGSTSITLKATYKNKTAEKTLQNVCVKENTIISFGSEKVVYDDDNDEYLLDITKTQKNQSNNYVQTKENLGFTLFDANLDKTENATWASTNEGIAKFENGEVVACGLGNCVISVEYTSTVGTLYTINLNVSVSLLKVDMGKLSFEMKEITGDPVYTNQEIFTTGTITGATFNGNDVYKSNDAGNNKVVLDRSKIENQQYGKDNVFAINTENVSFCFDCTLVDKFIETKSDLENLNVISRVGESYVWNGYYMLTDDIEYNGNFTDYQIAPYNYDNLDFSSNNNKDGSKGFIGTLDGDGHKIIGLEVGRTNKAGAGIFGVVGNNAVIKNIAFVHAKLEPGEPQYNSVFGRKIDHFSAYLVAYSAKCYINNVFISGQIMNEYRIQAADNGGVLVDISGNLLFGYTASFKPSVTNSMFILEKAPIKEAHYKTRVGNESATYDNVVFGTWQTHYTMPEGVILVQICTSYTTASYKTAGKLDMSKMDSEYWTTQDGDYFLFKDVLPYVDLKSYNGPEAKK